MPMHRWLGLAWLAATLLGAAAPAVRAQDDLLARTEAARVAAGAEPRRALETLRALRTEAQAAGELAARVAVDEAECRVLTDLDGRLAVAVAEAGIAAAGERPTGALRTAWLRLRACRAGVLIDMAQREPGVAELDALLALPETETPPAARAMALLERGVMRSRHGDYTRGQQDLLAACELLRPLPASPDQDLCLYHLANHYRRVGDNDEALRLLLGLHERARRSGAVFDDSVYVYSLAQIYQGQKRWPEALAAFRESAALNERQQDLGSLAYAEAGIGESLLRLGRPAEALPHVQRSLEPGMLGDDPRQRESRHGILADVLQALGRHGEALAALDAVGEAVRRRDDRTQLSGWLYTRARALHSQGRHREAYEALAESHALQRDLHEQKLSEQSARLRMQYNRARDTEELDTLRALNEQGLRLRNTQAVALALFVLLVASLLVLAVRKVRQARRLDELASTDELTGLANRRALFAQLRERIGQARRDGTRLALVMIDLDHFKRINDGHGHALGDLVLREVARVLAGALRGEDRLGRVGGEEFIAVLPVASPEAAAQVAERMRAAVAATSVVLPEGGELHFTASLGVAAWRPGESEDALVARADAALYRAKHGGRNRIELDDTPAVAPSAA